MVVVFVCVVTAVVVEEDVTIVVGALVDDVDDLCNGEFVMNVELMIFDDEFLKFV